MNGVTGLVVDHEESIFTGTAFCPLQCFDTDWFITSPTMKTHAWGGSSYLAKFVNIGDGSSVIT